MARLNLGRVVAALAVIALPWATQALTQPAAPGPAPAHSPEVQAAQKAAQAGDPASLVKLARAGDVDAQVAAGDAYFYGVAGKPDHAEARKWYAMAAKQNNAQARRRLGEMYARGDGGGKDTKKALELWMASEKAGDPLAAILVADQLFSDLTGGKKPGPGTYAFKGEAPTADIQVIEEWYQEAQNQDPRPDVQARATYALDILKSLRTVKASKKKP